MIFHRKESFENQAFSLEKQLDTCTLRVHKLLISESRTLGQSGSFVLKPFIGDLKISTAEPLLDENSLMVSTERTLVLSNPYPDLPVVFYEISCVQSLSEGIYQCQGPQNQWLHLSEHISWAQLQARQELLLEKPFKHAIIWCLEGTIEVNHVLMEATEALELTDSEAIEVESLSTQAELLVLYF